jgi:hypothetical protein
VKRSIGTSRNLEVPLAQNEPRGVVREASFFIAARQRRKRLQLLNWASSRGSRIKLRSMPGWPRQCRKIEIKSVL